MRTYRLDLRTLIVGLALLSGFLAFANTLHAAFFAAREQLIINTLEANRVYAQKVANVVELYIAAVRRQLRTSAERLPVILDSPHELQREVRRLVEQKDGISFAVILDMSNVVRAVYPDPDGLLNQTFIFKRMTSADHEHEVNITKPFPTRSGELAIAFTEPIRNKDGAAIGIVAAGLYLRKGSEFDELLGTQYYRNQSYAYVVDSDAEVLYHVDQARVGTIESQNEAVRRVLAGQVGALSVVNSKGVNMLAGFAPIKGSAWGVVAQRPMAATVAPLKDLIFRLLGYATPVALFLIALIFWLGSRIARPLSDLTRAMGSPRGAETASALSQVQPWYTEAANLLKVAKQREQIHENEVERLHDEVVRDPMTGLLNRRGLAEELRRLTAGRGPFSILALDLDHFKRVNDTFGHATGDLVLIKLGEIMRRASREGDIPCRVGGEEFLLLLAGSAQKEALEIAERVRKFTSETVMPRGVGHVTVSIGVASWPDADPDVEVVIKHADAALYAAKQSGRDRVVGYDALT